MKPHWELRKQFAAVHRVAALEGLNEGTWTHYSVAIPATRNELLVTPGDTHFADIRASGILHLDDAGTLIDGDRQPNRSAWAIHKPIHDLCPQAICILHAHGPYMTAMSILEGDVFETRASQHSATFHGRIAYLDEYEGIVQENKCGELMARTLGTEKQALILRNHGGLVAGRTINEAWLLLFMLERACRFQLIAMGAGREVRRMDETAAREVASHEEGSEPGSLAGMMRLLDRVQPDYST